MTRKQLLSIAAYAAAGLFALLLGVLALPVALGVLVAAALDPWVRRLQKATGMGRAGASTLCVSGTLLTAGSLLWLLGRILLRELGQLSRQLPRLLEAVAGYAAALNASLSELGSRLPGSIGDALGAWAEGLASGSGTLASGLYTRIFSLVSRLLSALPGSLFFLMTMVLSCYFAAAELPRLRELAAMHLPHRVTEPLRRLAAVLRRALGGWFRAQIMLMGLTFLLLLAGFLTLRVESPLLLALGVSVLDALPIFGTGTALLPWAAVNLMLGNFPLGLGLLALYATAALLRNVLEPRLLGAQMGLSPLLTLASIYAGWRLGGFWGMVLLPIATMTAAAFYRSVTHPVPEIASVFPGADWSFSGKSPEK